MPAMNLELFVFEQLFCVLFIIEIFITNTVTCRKLLLNEYYLSL